MGNDSFPLKKVHRQNGSLKHTMVQPLVLVIFLLVICNGFHQWFYQWPYQWHHQWPQQWSPTQAIRCFPFGFALVKYL